MYISTWLDYCYKTDSELLAKDVDEAHLKPAHLLIGSEGDGGAHDVHHSKVVCLHFVRIGSEQFWMKKILSHQQGEGSVH